MKNTILILIIILLSAMLLKQCNKRIEYKEQLENLIEYENDSVIYYRDKYDNMVAERKVLLGEKEILEHFYNKTLNDNEVLEELLDKKARVEYINTIEQEVIIDTIYLPLVDNKFDIKTPYYQLSGGLLNDSIRVDKLYIPNKVSLLTSTTRKGITTIKVVNSNPYIQTTDIESYMFKERKDYRKKRFGIGIQVGYNIKMEPYIGLGVSYNLFNF